MPSPEDPRFLSPGVDEAEEPDPEGPRSLVSRFELQEKPAPQGGSFGPRLCLMTRGWKAMVFLKPRAAGENPQKNPAKCKCQHEGSAVV